MKFIIASYSSCALDPMQSDFVNVHNHIFSASPRVAVQNCQFPRQFAMLSFVESKQIIYITRAVLMNKKYWIRGESHNFMPKVTSCIAQSVEYAYIWCSCLKPWPSYYRWIFSTAVLTLNFDLYLSIVNGDLWIWRIYWTSAPNFMKTVIIVIVDVISDVMTCRWRQ